MQTYVADGIGNRQCDRRMSAGDPAGLPPGAAGGKQTQDVPTGPKRKETSAGRRAAEEELVSVEYKHYDQDALVLLMQVARAAGIRAFVPGRSRYRVVVEGTQAQLDAVHKLATELGRALAIGQVKALVGVLEGAGLRVPTYVRKFLGKLQAKDAELSAANGSAEPAHT